MNNRKTETKGFSADTMTLANLKYLIESHYCNSMGVSALVCNLINERAAEARTLDRLQNEGKVIVPQGWYGGESGVAVVPA